MQRYKGSEVPPLEQTVTAVQSVWTPSWDLVLQAAWAAPTPSPPRRGAVNGGLTGVHGAPWIGQANEQKRAFPGMALSNKRFLSS